MDSDFLLTFYKFLVRPIFIRVTDVFKLLSCVVQDVPNRLGNSVTSEIIKLWSHFVVCEITIANVR